MLQLDSEIFKGKQRVSCSDSDGTSFGSQDFPAFPKQLSRLWALVVSRSGIEERNSMWLLHDLSHTIGIQILAVLQPGKEQNIFSAKAEYLTVALTNQLVPDQTSLRIKLPFTKDYIRESYTLREADTLLLTAEIIVATIIEDNPGIEELWKGDLEKLIEEFRSISASDRREFSLKIPQRTFSVDLEKCLSIIGDIQKSIFLLTQASNTGKFIYIEEIGTLKDFIEKCRIALNRGSNSQTQSPDQQIERECTLRRLKELPLYSDRSVTPNEILQTFLNLKTFQTVTAEEIFEVFLSQSA
jgi:hypothetical protein